MPVDLDRFGSSARTSDVAKSRREFDEFVRNEEAKDRQRLEQSVQSLTVVPALASHAMRVHNFEMTEAWSAPLAEIQAVMDSGKWTSLYWLLHLRDENEGPRVKQTAQEAEQAFRDYCANLPQRTGFKLLDPERLAKMVVVQLRWGRIEVTPETIDAALDTLLKNHCFQDGEVEYDANWKTAAPAQQAANASAVVDFEALNLTGSEEDEKRGKEAVEFLAQTAAASTGRAWIASLAANFGFVPTVPDLSYMVKWFRENNRSWFTPASYDAFRLHMVHTGRWSTALLSEPDIRARAIDRLDMNDRDVRGIVFHGSKEALLDLMQRRGVSLI